MHDNFIFILYICMNVYKRMEVSDNIIIPDLELKNTLDRMLDLATENEVVEFKEVKESYDFRKLGKYFSALNNLSSV